MGSGWMNTFYNLFAKTIKRLMAYYHSKYSTRKKRSKRSRLLIYLTILAVIPVLIGTFFMYQIFYKTNVWMDDKEKTSVFIPSGSSFDEVKCILYSQGLIIHRNNFEWLAKKKSYPSNIKAGHYLLKQGMSNLELINLLRSGNQTPVKLIFNNIRGKEQFAQRISQQIQADSTSIINLLNDSTYLANLGLNEFTATTIFIPNTYQVFWTIKADDFIKRMKREYNKFWNADRRQKIDSMEMSIVEVITLASIVEKESQKNDEKSRIAGVYINRLTRNWYLQADPTLVYAIGDFEIKRVLNIHKEIDSPFNTYKKKGLPPGPICIPSISSIDAVLNFEEHRYLYFCAKDDLSGYHVFANSYLQHEQNARKYRRALNKLRIYK